MSSKNDDNDTNLVSDFETDGAAEEKKELGNQAFANKDYQGAISYYTEAITRNPKNHIYYSNRSACHVALEQWVEAAADAKQCLKLCPQFVKAYYRLSLAQMAMDDLDAAQSTVKMGLNVEPNSLQLSKQLRLINAEIKKKKAAATATSKKIQQENANSRMMNATSSQVTGSGVDSEIVDLQNQFRDTLRDYNIAKSFLDKYQREQKINEFTKAEIEESLSSTSNMYRGIGKMFLKQSPEDIVTYLNDQIQTAQKKEMEMNAKMEYLDKHMKSQQQNMAELTKSLPNTFST
jgi:tetratricopeptide (TPR) repeat protein